MKNIKIVDYEHKYAKGVAEMWQNSNNGWNGETFFTTEQAVIMDEENATHLNSWLALDGEVVVGYCNLSEYKADTGALYIGLLNVRDDYHGKKIGKALVLKAVERTIELGWERLDLFTWDGNTKAVPLYKKTGFFWEDNDDSTHLINLIPSVLNNELIKDHFQEIDWYEDSIRKIEVVPDGRKENGFEYLTYEWEKKGKHLLVEFCRRGRGLRKIENDDLSITVTVEDLKLVFGNKYKIKFEIVNKTEKPLEIGINGINEKNIKFDISKEFAVIDSKTIEAEFYVGNIEKEQNKWKTYPNVISEISVNGKKTKFKIGIEPKFPAKIGLVQIDGICYKDVETEIFVDIENCFKEKTTFSFDLPETEYISFHPKKFEIALKPKEKRSIPIKYLLKKGCVYSQEIGVKVHKENSEFSFKRKLHSFFPTYSDIFYGKMQNYHVVSNGKYVLYFRCKDFINRAFFVDFTSNARISFPYPKLGKPYSDEFNKRQYDKVKYSSEGSIARFTIYYSSKEIKGLKFKNNFELSANGILKNWFEFYGNVQTEKGILLKNNFGMPFSHSVMHYDGNLIETKTDVENSAENWNPEKITEPWIFSERDDVNIGVVWNDDNPLQLGDWEKYFEFRLEKMETEKKISTKPIIYFINTFQNYEELRNFALKEKKKNKKILESLQFDVNDGNPFVKKDISFSVRDYKTKKLIGKISVTSQKELFKKVLGNFTENKELVIKTQINEKSIIDIAEMNAELGCLKFTRRKVFSPIGKGDVKYSKTNDIHSVNNEILTLRASENFAPALYSMEYKKNEWLDSSYPKSIAKSWWKPWIGGIYFSPPGMKEKSLLSENFKIRNVLKEDVLGNDWSGLCIEYTITKNEKFKGIKIKQYFLLLPNIPVMLSTLEIFQNTGKYISNQYIQTACFLKPDETLADSSFLRKEDNCDDIEIVAGKEMQNRQTKKCAIFKGKNRKEILQIKSVSEHRNIYVQMDTNVISAWIGDMLRTKNGETVFLNHQFYIFNDEIIEDSVLVDLQNVKFEKE